MPTVDHACDNVLRAHAGTNAPNRCPVAARAIYMITDPAEDHSPARLSDIQDPFPVRSQSVINPGAPYSALQRRVLSILGG
ncbi:hypothetical protein GCM10023107_11500 [Actinoplanes octamycinicus]|nr:hypothetical protein Aoc01nite_76140 [Actinoplanes octamycinicus]